MRRRHAAALASAALLIGGLATVNAIGVRFNATPSMPIGFWRVTEVNTPLRIGSVVVACPPDNAVIRQAVARGYIAAGNCPDSREPLLKTVGAIGGDVVAVSEAGVAVNGKLLAGSVPLENDSAGRTLTPFAAANRQLRTDEVWLTANSDPRSFDSRYFGPVPASHVVGMARPIWLFQ